MSCDCGFVDVPPASGVAPDPTKHVNYVLGMVLGADDFVQEFAYHAERDRWAARDLVGYGTAWGLQVQVEQDGDVRVTVAPGVAVMPSGQVVRVVPAQCASLNEWLRAHAAEPRLQAPQDRRLRVHVTVGYRACLSDARPVPGEPCRSDTDMLQPSRVTDGFDLRLELDAPTQREEDAIRELLRWLGDNVQAEAQASLPLTPAAFADAVAAAFVRQDGTAASVPTAPEAPLVIPADAQGDYVRAALRAWVTRIRPRWRPDFLGPVHSCDGALAPQGNAGDRLLLAALDIEVDRRPGDTAWSVKGLPAIDEEDRPILAAGRMLQEWLLAAPGGWLASLCEAARASQPPAPPRPPVVPIPPVPVRVEPPAQAVAPPAPEYRVVAAGLVSPGSTSATFGGLRVAQVLAPGTLLLTFDGLTVPRKKGTQYVVKALPAPASETSRAKESLTVTFGGYRDAAAGAPDGFVLQVRDGGTLVPRARLEALGLQVEVCRFEGR